MHHSEMMDQLFDAVLTLRSREECYMFFEDICTMKELTEMSQRLEIARLLSAGQKYGAVSAATGVSSATISRVNRCLQYGSGGYQLTLGRVADQRKRESEDDE